MSRKPLPLIQRVCCACCYALLATLGWLLLTGNPYPLAITLVASFAAVYAAETPKR